VNPEKSVRDSIKKDYSKIKHLSLEPEFSSFKQLCQVPEIFLTLKRIERLNQIKNSEVLHETSCLKLETLSQGDVTIEIPVYKLSLEFPFYIPLKKILDSVLLGKTRQEWDEKLVLVEDLETVFHSIFEYSIYSAEFYEEVFKFTHENSVGVMLRSVGGYEKSEKFIRPVNHFTLYNISEKNENSFIEIFIKIDPKTFMAVIVQQVLKENVLAWGEKLYQFLSS
jgi:hypothetical protein